MSPIADIEKFVRHSSTHRAHLPGLVASMCDINDRRSARLLACLLNPQRLPDILNHGAHCLRHAIRGGKLHSSIPQRTKIGFRKPRAIRDVRLKLEEHTEQSWVSHHAGITGLGSYDSIDPNHHSAGLLKNWSKKLGQLYSRHSGDFKHLRLRKARPATHTQTEGRRRPPS